MLFIFALFRVEKIVLYLDTEYIFNYDGWFKIEKTNLLFCRVIYFCHWKSFILGVPQILGTKSAEQTQKFYFSYFRGLKQ